MKEFRVTYRQEFAATVEAKTEDEAIAKFQQQECGFERVGQLWPDYFEIEAGFYNIEQREDISVQELKQKGEL